VKGAEIERAMTDDFRAAGRALFSLGLVRETEGNLSTFDGATLVITRSGAPLGELGTGHLVAGSLETDLEGASSDLGVHRGLYRERGPGAVVHAHPPGSVPEGEVSSGEHGVYVFASSLERAVEIAVSRARDDGRTPAEGSGR
jgi:ribulose-5-phosphate 4-epimerase/fuculose-1-phosphate aldolase